MGRLRLARDDRDLDVAAARVLQKLVQVGFPKTEPAVGIKRARFLKLMLRQIEDREAPTL